MTCTCEHANHVPLDDFLPYVMPHVSGVPAEIAAHNVRLAAIQFCTESLAIKRSIYTFLQEGVLFYDIEAPSCERIRSIHSVTVNGCCYEPVRVAKDLRCGNRFFYEKGHGLHIGIAPCDLADGVEVVANVTPSQDTCYLDQCMYDDYAETLASGAMSRLFAMPSATWFDLQLARYHRGLYQEGTAGAKQLNAKGGSTAPMYMKPRRFV